MVRRQTALLQPAENVVQCFLSAGLFAKPDIGNERERGAAPIHFHQPGPYAAHCRPVWRHFGPGLPASFETFIKLLPRFQVVIGAGASKQYVLIILSKAFGYPFLLAVHVGQHEVAEFVCGSPVLEKCFDRPALIDEQFNAFAPISDNTAKRYRGPAFVTAAANGDDNDLW